MLRLHRFFSIRPINRGLKPREEVGPALEKGKPTLLNDRAWATPRATRSRILPQDLSVDAPDETPPDAEDVAASKPPPPASVRHCVLFPQGDDHALLTGLRG